MASSAFLAPTLPPTLPARAHIHTRARARARRPRLSPRPAHLRPSRTPSRVPCAVTGRAAAVPEGPLPAPQPSPNPPSVLDAIPSPSPISASSSPSPDASASPPAEPVISVASHFSSADIIVDDELPIDVEVDIDIDAPADVPVMQASDDMAASWARKGAANAVARTFEIWTFFFSCLTSELRIRKLADPAEQRERRLEAAVRLKDGLLRLGPTFIKLGQLLSTRVDIVPKEYIDQLAILQDRVPGFSGDRAIAVIEQEFQRPISQVFDSFDPTPIAAASLGQVHRAVIDGDHVAVKIQRAGLKELFDVDLKNLKLLAKLLDKLDPKTDGAKRNWVQIYDESAKLLYEEIDYMQEGRNADRFRRNFEDVPWVKVPGIYWDLTSTKVLTMEYVPGIKINDYAAIERAGLDRTVIAQRSAESYLTQLLRHGYFHTDPHCGNLAVDTVAGGRIIYYDFGMMSTFEPNIKKGLVDVVFGIYEGSASEICDAMVRMGVLSSSADRITVEKVGRYFLGLFRTNLSNSNRKKTKEEKRAEMLKRLDSIGEDLLAVGEDECFNFPPVFTFVFRAFTTLEGIGKGLDSGYDLTIIAGPYLKELIDIRDGSATVSAVKAFRKKVGWRGEDLSAVVSQPRKTAYIEKTIRRLETGDLRLRVRVLESERNFKKVVLMQDNMAVAMGAATCANMAVVLMTAAEKFALQAKILWVAALIMCVKLVIGMLKYRAMEARMRKFVGGSGR